MAVNWNGLSIKEAEELLGTDFVKGLSQKIVRQRAKKLNPNTYIKQKAPLWLFDTLKMLSEISVWILILSSIIGFFVFPFENALTLFLALIVSAILIIVCYTKIQKKLLSYLKFFSRKITVIRDGKEQKVPASFLVAGDIVKLFAGDLVPSECFIIAKGDLKISSDISADEKIIPKESRILSGSCVCAVIGMTEPTDEDSEMALYRRFFENSSLYKSAHRISCFSLAIIACLSLITLLSGLILKRGSDFAFSGFISYTILVNGALFQFLHLILLSLFCRSFVSDKTLEKRAVVNSAGVIDKLTSLDCLLISSDLFFSRENPQPMAYYTNGSLCLDAKLTNLKGSALGDVVFATEKAVLSCDSAEKNKALCLSECFGEDFKSFDSVVSYRLSSTDFPFDTFIFKGANNEKYASVKGDLNSIVQASNTVCYGSKIIAFDDGLKSSVRDACGKLTALGCEVVAYAKNLSQDISLDSTHLSHKRLTFLGFVAYAKGQAEASDDFFSLCENNTISPLVLHYGTKQELKVYSSCSKWISRLSAVDATLLGNDETLIHNALSEHDIFINPTDKQIEIIHSVISKNGFKWAHISKQNQKSDTLTVIFANESEKAEKPPHTKERAVVENNISVVQALLSNALDFKKRMSQIISFLYGVCLTRAFIIPFSLFAEKSFFTPLQMAVLTLISDSLVVGVLVASKTRQTREVSLGSLQPTLKSVAVFLILPVLNLIISGIFTLFNFEADIGIFCSLCFLEQLILPLIYMTFFLKSAFNEKLLAYLFGSLIFITFSVIFSSFGTFFGIVSNPILLPFAIICSVLYHYFYKKLIIN